MLYKPQNPLDALLTGLRKRASKEDKRRANLLLRTQLFQIIEKLEHLDDRVTLRLA